MSEAPSRIAWARIALMRDRRVFLLLEDIGVGLADILEKAVHVDVVGKTCRHTLRGAALLFIGIGQRAIEVLVAEWLAGEGHPGQSLYLCDCLNRHICPMEQAWLFLGPVFGHP